VHAALIGMCSTKLSGELHVAAAGMSVLVFLATLLMIGRAEIVITGTQGL